MLNIFLLKEFMAGTEKLDTIDLQPNNQGEENCFPKELKIGDSL